MTDEPATDPVAMPPTDEQTPHEPEAAPASAAESLADPAAPSPEVQEITEPQSPVAETATPTSETVEVAATLEETDSTAEPELAPSPAELSGEEEMPATDGEPVAEVTSSEPQTDEESPAKPKRTRAPKKVAATAAATAVEPTAVAVAEGEEPAPAENKKKWYAIKVQSGREDTIKAAILRKVAIEGLEEFFGRIEIPVEEEIVKKSVRVKDKKTGEYTTQEKKVTKKKKKFHGYIFAELEFNDRILYLIRETSGVGDFLNMRTKPGQPPTPEPMPEHEVQAMLTGERQRDPLKAKKVKLDFEKGDKVRIRDGSFANSEGEVKSIAEAKDPTDTPKVTVVLTFWGRPLDVELDASQVEKV